MFDIKSGNQIPFVSEIADNQYHIEFGTDTADTIAVDLAPIINGNADSVEHEIYTVRFPKVS